MPYRPRDICSAAFYDDIERLHLLVTNGAPGGYEDDEGEELEEDQEAAIDADEELVQFRKMFSLGEGDDEEADDEHGEDDDDDDPELLEAEEEARAKDAEHFRLLVRRKLRHRAIAAAINKPGLLKAGTTPVTVTEYGVLFTGAEVAQHHTTSTGTITKGGAVTTAASLFAAPTKQNEAERAAAAAAATTRELGDEESEVALRVMWKPSKRSPIPAYPLHWAVQGRAHNAVAFLILNGADTKLGVGDAIEEYNSRRRNGGGAASSFLTSSDSTTSISSEVAAELAAKFPSGLTAEAIATANQSVATLEALSQAVAARDAGTHALETEKQQICSRLEQLKARREKRRLEREQRRALEEEEELRAAAAEEDEEGEYDEDDEGNY